ncbi:hypothetical protein L0Z64_01665 [Phaeobacter sp. BS23]|uniref:hypothetical protein n=1 Tax=Phaeobacter sp. BS23 TaxID=2907239 RepID=UPI00386B8E5D
MTSLLSYGGDDTIHGGEGTDTLNGGDGFDVLSYKGHSTAVRIKLAEQTSEFIPSPTNYVAERSDFRVRRRHWH